VAVALQRIIRAAHHGVILHFAYYTIATLAAKSRKLAEFRDYYNAHRVHRALGGATPSQHAGVPSAALASLDHHAWRQHCRGLFQIPIAA
jgi:hypothetical protein